MDANDYLATLGTLGFTYRTRRLVDRIAESGRRFYDARDLPLEPNWHALLLYLEEHGPVSVTEAAAALRLSHPAVIDLARRIEARGLINAERDPGDGRRRVLRLSDEGRSRMPEFRAVWAAIADELDEVIERTAGGDALACLAAIERQLDEQELDRRVLARLDREQDMPAHHAADRPALDIRPVAADDREPALHIARELVRSGDTYAYEPDIGDEELWRYWCPSGPGRGFVAEGEEGIVGIFVIRPNNPGPGAHVANASYAVRADMRGMGVGRAMGEASLVFAAGLGYSAMQFNTVVSTNLHALRLWRSLGFRVVGTVPGGFRLPDGTTVDHHVMYRSLP